MMMERNTRGSARARNHRICFKTTRCVNAQVHSAAVALGLSRSGAAHWCMAAWGRAFSQDSWKATQALLGALEVEDAGELRKHLDKLVADDVPW